VLYSSICVRIVFEAAFSRRDYHLPHLSAQLGSLTSRFITTLHLFTSPHTSLLAPAVGSHEAPLVGIFLAPLARVLDKLPLVEQMLRAGGEGRHHKQQHRLDEEETQSHVIGSRHRAGQWASFKATRTPSLTGLRAAPRAREALLVVLRREHILVVLPAHAPHADAQRYKLHLNANFKNQERSHLGFVQGFKE
jgi:hypothetical protein